MSRGIVQSLALGLLSALLGGLVMQGLVQRENPAEGDPRQTSGGLLLEHRSPSSRKAVSQTDEDGTPTPQIAARLEDSTNPIATIEQLASAVASDKRPGFISDELFRLAESDPELAMSGALQLEDFWHALDCADRIASVWGRKNPEVALTYAGLAHAWPPEIESSFRLSILQAWADADPEGALSYLLRPQNRMLFQFDSGEGRRIADAIATEASEALLTAANSLPVGAMRRELRAAAINALVKDDLDSALRRAEAARSGPDQVQWIAAITPIFVDRDPVAALAWARSLDPTAPGTLRGVVRAVYSTYPERSEELGLCAQFSYPVPDCQR